MEKKSSEVILKDIYSSDDSIELVSYYKDIPIRHQAKIQKIDDDGKVVFHTDVKQVVAIKETSKVIAISERYNDIFLEATYVSLCTESKNCVVVDDIEVRNFEYIKRKDLRVVPDPSFSIKVIDPLVKIYDDVEVVDLTDEAVAFIFKKELPSRIQENTLFHVKMTFIIDDIHTPVEITLKTKLIRLEHNLEEDKFVAKFEHISTEHRNIIDRYLNKRQLQIIRDFKRILDSK